MAKSRLIVRDRGGGLNSIRRRMLDLSDKAVKVGVLEGAGDHDPLKIKRNKASIKQAMSAAREREVNRVLSIVPKVISPKAARAAAASANRSGRWSAEAAKLERTESILRNKPSIAMVAFWNEFGTKTAPSRPAFRMAFRARGKDAIGKLISKVTSDVARGKRGEMDALKMIGAGAQSILRSSIVELSSPPNARRTIQRKKSTNPLVDSGQLVRAVTYAIVGGAEARSAVGKSVASRGLTAPVRGAA